ncbi:MAG: sigma-70 family RNA polymerase sigma factor [Tannerellaceae bacterium]|jgi:RNA polymerase sigma-70 factor (ECF subfamily)|nr:sigma-70 family RNA polymerase sigma factor [Tannerellaceae bacterium]
MDEKLLIDGYMRGEPWACKEIYDTYAPAMMSVCMRYVNNRETARDLLQEGFIKVFQKKHTFLNTGLFAGWLRRIFVTTALEYLRKNEASKPANLLEDYSDRLYEMDESALDRLSAEELLACIARLPDGYRVVFNLFAIEGYSHQEIAGMLGISEVTSRTQFIRARSALQKRVQSLIKNEDVRQQRSRQIP